MIPAQARVSVFIACHSTLDQDAKMNQGFGEECRFEILEVDETFQGIGFVSPFSPHNAEWLNLVLKSWWFERRLSRKSTKLFTHLGKLPYPRSLWLRKLAIRLSFSLSEEKNVWNATKSVQLRPIGQTARFDHETVKGILPKTFTLAQIRYSPNSTW